MWSKLFKRKPEVQINNSDNSDALRLRLLQDEIKRQYMEGGDDPLVSLQDFFTGNGDVSSIGCNTSPPVSHQTFYHDLKHILSSPVVKEIWLGIRDPNDDDPLSWPFSDELFIVTTASLEEVKQWLEPIQPDEVDSSFINQRLQSAKSEDGVQIYRAWWD